MLQDIQEHRDAKSREPSDSVMYIQPSPSFARKADVATRQGVKKRPSVESWAPKFKPKVVLVDGSPQHAEWVCESIWHCKPNFLAYQ